MQVKFTQVFGSHGQGAVADLPDQVATSLIRTGVAVAHGEPETAPILKTEAYAPAKGVRKTVSKAV